MLLVGCKLPASNNHIEKQKSLARMGKDELHVEDVEEGEISDSASVEEISEEDFNKLENRVSKSKEDANGIANSNTRVWPMRDLYKYPVCRGYASNLYNIAWAQAVQNKPLDEVLVKIDHDENSKRSSSSPSNSTSANCREDKNNGVIPSKEAAKVIIDDSCDEMDGKMEGVGDKEAVELEEGEIDLDSEPIRKPEEASGGGLSDNLSVSDNSKINLKEEEEMEKRVSVICEALKNVNVFDAEKSFDGVCSRLQSLLKSLLEVILENSVPMKDTLIQLSFSAIQTVISVFCSMNQIQKEENKDFLLRLLACVTSQVPPIFISEKMKEIEAMMFSLDSYAVFSSSKLSDKERDIQIDGVVNRSDSSKLGENAGHDLISLKNSLLRSMSVDSLNKSNPNILSDGLKPGLSNLKVRGGFGPLLDLHKDHDADSLPSPTREAPAIFPVQNALVVGDGYVKSELHPVMVARETQDFVMHPYETDAVRAVSSYQQKFGRTSFLLSDRLPSPTPSEDGDDGDGDTSGEVSSSSVVGNVPTGNPPIFSQLAVSSTLPADSFSVQGSTSSRNAGPVCLNPIVKATAKSRDPRLRYANSDMGVVDFNQRPLPVAFSTVQVEPLEGIVSSRKHKTAEESGGPATKRPRNGLTNSVVNKDAETVPGSGGLLDDNDTLEPCSTNKIQLTENSVLEPMKLENGVTYTGSGSGNLTATMVANEQLPVTGTIATASLPAILKDIAVNPALLMNLLKIGEHQRLSAEVQLKSGEPVQNNAHPPSANSILGAVPSVNIASSTSSRVGQKVIGKLQAPSQTVSLKNTQDELGKIRMKPRDPRRVLHNNTFQKSESSGSEQLKTNAAPSLSSQGSKNNFDPQKKDILSDANSTPSLCASPPDITWQFTKNLKNIADLMSISVASATSVAPQGSSLDPGQVSLDRMEVKSIISDSDNLRTSPVLTSEGAAGPSLSQCTWGDFEHLFEGYDDLQKAAIQRERARRIEEQKKMFAARKLCLVLDLDHTLLNSAKFIEVDPVHDEILRKKEEQDHDKSQRHLFRFSHMGMWTKLRPGIWNFLEKASKLYELHLYTMGNKLYATEMAKVLDPKGMLFAGRVISRGDDGDIFDGDERVPKSKDLDGVLGMESAVVIIDDSVRVWPHHKLNLIVVERYTYFPCSRRQFGLAGPSLLEIDHDERPEDGTLASSLAVIERIHQNFFSHRSLDELDVRNILALEQQKILAGCRIVFSRVFPVGEANPHLHPLWQTAEQFGAACTNQIDEQVTHVVANSLGTDKVNWALSTGRFVVHPGWVEASALLYRRANEQDFAIKP